MRDIGIFPSWPEKLEDVGIRDEVIDGPAGWHCRQTASNTDKGMNQLRKRTPASSTVV
jgi:hypothetical protein